MDGGNDHGNGYCVYWKFGTKLEFVARRLYCRSKTLDGRVNNGRSFISTGTRDELTGAVATASLEAVAKATCMDARQPAGRT